MKNSIEDNYYVLPDKLFLIYGEADNQLYLMDTNRERAEALMRLLQTRTKRKFYFKVTNNAEVIKDIMA